MSSKEYRPAGDWSRREFMQVMGAAGLGLAGFALVGCSTGSSSGSGSGSSAGSGSASVTLTIMTVGGSWGDSIRDLIAKPYAEKHNLQLAWDNRPNAQQIAAIQAMRGKPTVDTAEVGGPHMANAIALGLVDPIDPKRVPNFAKIHPNFKNEFWAARSMSPFVLTYDKTRVTRAEAQAQGWNLLLDPKLKGKVAIPKFAWQGEMWLNALNLSLGGTYENMDPAVKLARGIIHDNGGKVMESNDNGMNMFTTGEIWAAPFWTGRTYELSDKGVSVEFVYPKGWTAYTFGFVIVKGISHKELVEGFVDYSLSPEVQMAVAKQFSYVPTLADLQIPDNLPRLKIAKEDLDKSINVDYAQAAKYSDKNLERWNKEILG